MSLSLSLLSTDVAVADNQQLSLRVLELLKVFGFEGTFTLAPFILEESNSGLFGQVRTQ